MITQDELKEMLHYDPETGIFTWLVARGQRVRPGSRAGSVSNGYIQVMIRSKPYQAHRLAWLYVHGAFPPADTDHVNGVKDDNRLCNLRPATRSQNVMNQGKQNDNTSGFKGVFWHEGAKKWMAQCMVNGKKHYLGLFVSAEAASAAYKAFAVKHHGEFYHVAENNSRRSTTEYTTREFAEYMTKIEADAAQEYGVLFQEHVRGEYEKTVY